MRDALAPPPAKRAAKKSSADELRTVTLVCRFVNEQGDALASSAPIVVEWTGTVASSIPSTPAPDAVPAPAAVITDPTPPSSATSEKPAAKPDDKATCECDDYFSNLFMPGARRRGVHVRCTVGTPGPSPVLPTPMPAVRVTRETTTIKPPTRSWPRPAADVATLSSNTPAGIPAWVAEHLPKLRCFQLLVVLPATIGGKPVAEAAVASDLRATATAEGALTVAFTLATTDGDTFNYALAFTVPAALDVDECCASALPGCVTLRAPYTRLGGLIASGAATAICRPVRPAALRPRDLTSLCCRFCDAPLVREATGAAGAITQSTPLPSGLLDELSDCLMCFDGPAAVPLESAAACAKPARCLEGETSLLLHVSDLRNTVTVVAEDAESSAEREVRCARCESVLGRPANDAASAARPMGDAIAGEAEGALLFKHKLACRPSEADLLGSNSAAWHVATLLAREVTTRSVHRFELCARTGSGTAQSWRSVHLLLVSWDSEAATSRNASSLHTVLKLCFQMGNPSQTLHAATPADTPARWVLHLDDWEEVVAALHANAELYPDEYHRIHRGYLTSMLPYAAHDFAL